MKIQRIRLYFVIFVLILGKGGDFQPTLASTEQSPILSFLASDDNYTNSRIVNYDLDDGQIVEDISLPADLAIAAIYWSPNHEYIAAVVGERTNNLEFSGNSICIFSRHGETIWCEPISIAHIPGPVGGLWPAPLTWMPDSQHLAVITADTVDAASASLSIQLSIMNVEQPSEASSYEFDLNATALFRWRWSPDGDFAAVLIRHRELSVYQLYIVTAPPQIESILLAPDVGIALDVTQSAIAYVGRGEESYLAPLEIASREDDTFVLSHELGEPDFNGRLITKELGISNDGNTIALTSPAYNDENVIEHTLYFLNVESGEVSQDGPSYHWIDQLAWSPDSDTIAARQCDGYGPRLCQMGIYSLDGEFIIIDTEYSENRSPQWLSDDM